MRYTYKKLPCLIKRPYFTIKIDLGDQNGWSKLNLTTHSPWDGGQTDIKLGTKHNIYHQLTTFTWGKDVFVNRLEGVCKCVFYRPEYNAKEGPHGISKL